jgi:hypothetical protein
MNWEIFLSSPSLSFYRLAQDRRVHWGASPLQVFFKFSLAFFLYQYKTSDMNPKELIAILEKLPQDLPIRLVSVSEDGQNEENIWLSEVELSNTGDSGYEVSGEIRLIGNE